MSSSPSAPSPSLDSLAPPAAHREYPVCGNTPPPPSPQMSIATAPACAGPPPPHIREQSDFPIVFDPSPTVEQFKLSPPALDTASKATFIKQTRDDINLYSAVKKHATAQHPLSPYNEPCFSDVTELQHKMLTFSARYGNLDDLRVRAEISKAVSLASRAQDAYLFAMQLSALGPQRLSEVSDYFADGRANSQ